MAATASIRFHEGTWFTALNNNWGNPYVLRGKYGTNVQPVFEKNKPFIYLEIEGPPIAEQAVASFWAMIQDKGHEYNAGNATHYVYAKHVPKDGLEVI